VVAIDLRWDVYWPVAQRVVASQPCAEAISVDRKGSPGIGTECHKRVCKLRSVLLQWRRAGDTPLGRNSTVPGGPWLFQSAATVSLRQLRYSLSGKCRDENRDIMSKDPRPPTLSSCAG
jgi:hypothetical protein